MFLTGLFFTCLVSGTTQNDTFEANPNISDKTSNSETWFINIRLVLKTFITPGIKIKRFFWSLQNIFL